MNERPSRGLTDPKNPAIAALIPAYNEEAVIGSVVAGTLKQITNVIVVDDGSTDATARLARAAGADVLALRQNRGQGGRGDGRIRRGHRARVRRRGHARRGRSAQPRRDRRRARAHPRGRGRPGHRLALPRDPVRDPPRVLGQKTLNLFTALGAGVS